MIEITKLKAFNLDGAFRGMRQPFKTTEKSDSLFGIEPDRYFSDTLYDFIHENYLIESEEDEEKTFDYYYENGEIESNYHAILYALIGPNDLKLAQKLIAAGSPHDKFMRQIFVSMDINAPLYFWKELSTYKVGTVANSESTMHTIMKFPFSKEMFSIDNSILDDTSQFEFNYKSIIESTVDLLNTLRDSWLTLNEEGKLDNINKKYYEEQKKQIWRSIIQILPCSYMQKRTWTANYSILRALAHQREGHKLIEWSEFREAIGQLPYADELIFYKGEK